MLPPEPATRHDDDEPTTLERRRGHLFETIQMGGGMVLFLAMLYQMQTPFGARGFLSPLLLALVGALLLWPLREHRTTRTILLAGVAVLMLWLLTVLSSVLLPFMLVFVLASLFNPLVTRLEERRGVPRWGAAMGATLLSVGLVVLFILQLVPALMGQVETLAVRAIEGVGRLQEWLATSSVLDQFAAAGLLDKEAFLSEMATTVQTQTEAFSQNLPDLAQQVLGYLGSIFGLITLLAVVPVVLYYTLKDFPVILNRLMEVFPTFGGRRDYLIHAGTVVGSYLRGQLIISAIAAVNISVLLLLLDVPFALLIGLLSGVLNMVPNLGALLSAAIGVLFAMVFGDPWLWTALKVLLVIVGQNLLEQAVLTPKILSRQVGLHPVLILLSLFVFGYFMGLLGLVIAVPATALIMTTYKAYREDLTLELSSDAQLKRDLARRVLGRFKPGDS